MRLPTEIAAIAALLLAAQAVPAQETLGAELFRRHCAACHGAAGEGDGPVAAAMRVNVPNLRSLAQRSAGVFPADAVLAYIDGREIKAAHGNRQMPVWGDVFADDDSVRDAPQGVRGRLAALVGYIAELQYQ